MNFIDHTFISSEMSASKSDHVRLVRSNTLDLQRQAWALSDVQWMSRRDNLRQIHSKFVKGDF